MKLNKKITQPLYIWEEKDNFFGVKEVNLLYEKFEEIEFNPEEKDIPIHMVEENLPIFNKLTVEQVF